MSHHLVLLLPFLGLLLLAAVIDWRCRRIPNWLNLIIVLGGVAQTTTAYYGISTTQSLLGLCAGFALLFIPFAMGAMGGGDVKLLAGVGAWLGPVGALATLLVASVVGLVIVIFQAAYSGKLGALFKNSALLVVNLVHFREVGADHIEQTGKGFRSVDRPLPYAVPILAAVLVVITIL